MKSLMCSVRLASVLNKLTNSTFLHIYNFDKKAIQTKNVKYENQNILGVMGIYYLLYLFVFKSMLKLK